MGVKRIVADIEADDLSKADAFYGDLLGLKVAMDIGWFRTYVAESTMTVQISFGTEGGSGTPVPDLSIEVDDLDRVIEKIDAIGIKFEYGPCEEPWGVRRFFVRDPFGKLVNILQHT